jgi:hypothetical protein
MDEPWWKVAGVWLLLAAMWCAEIGALYLAIH